ncbi:MULTISPECIES: hypothetical protein [unclassified Mesorhizobium]|uniref:hypothetical protein n=1 Tax=unclassified Mesorhizobium TaxID=325217 RepID=UPI000FCA3F4E|nr:MULTISPECIES: hypothetical protein [unclassified Mesorhizobium]MDG4854624.1 hypothetical protein [Mesorhizobium sp. WSM4982]MDG4908691.1 hypothetical protein [Mesorhizobium sp. WSM4898]MDG4916054.1 hypothetical protein [Mesorhizobium sp. WSM4983]RUV44581.1 hypothetical protein EOD29_07375 [Mesorhizobium sp. M1A.T.Ca.IN.004.03.1.1]RWI98917.1 MAG: hypothetical protein EOR22_02415 [Mesorhizobium sp.]
MSKTIELWKDTYDPETLAEKYGLTVAQAKIVISSNGPSKHGCDVGAIAFRRALEMRSKTPTRNDSTRPG